MPFAISDSLRVLTDKWFSLFFLTTLIHYSDSLALSRTIFGTRERIRTSSTAVTVQYATITTSLAWYGARDRGRTCIFHPLLVSWFVAKWDTRALVLPERIELSFHPYQGCVIPVYYGSKMVAPEGFDPSSSPWKGDDLATNLWGHGGKG